ncbi:MAG: glycosyltransferase family 4 protein [Thermodesulfovibrio sp.]|nr:glycosyltransferase family 4 protein [Thermodesulfovibrio sp.]
MKEILKENIRLRGLYLRTVYWFNLTAGGSVTHTAGVINAMSKYVDLKVVSNDTLVGVRTNVEIVKPVFIPFIPKNLNELLYNFKIIKHCMKYNFDFIYQRHSAFSFCGSYLSKIKGVPLILEHNGSETWMSKHWSAKKGRLYELLKNTYNEKFLFKIMNYVEKYNTETSSIIVVVSNALKEHLAKHGVDNHKIIVNPNGVDPDIYRPDIYAKDIIDKYELSDKVVIGFIGTFEFWHGVENIPLAYGKLLLEHPELRKTTRLMLIGDGPKMKKVEENIKKMKIQHNVILTGTIPQHEGPRYLSACDILMNPTIPNPDNTEFFGSPTKLFEYMAMGKAIICSDMAQMSEILKHKVDAYLVKPGDIDGMARAMKELIYDKNLREYIGRNAREKVIASFTWDKHVQRIIEVLLDKINKDKINKLDKTNK